MISEREALDAILAAVPPAEAETLPLSAAAGRFAAEDVVASLSLPGFDNSAMDGWAIHETGCGRAGVRLRVTGQQPAGADRRLTVREGEAVRIFTGAPLPAGTGAVVMQEDADCEGGEVVIREATQRGEFIRRAGSDVCAGQLLIRRGARLTAQRVGVLASQGRGEVSCGRRPGVAIVCTGEELVAPGVPLPCAGALYNSNGPMLAALLESSRTAEVRSTAMARDDPAELTAALRAGLEAGDVLIIAGGVSVGEYDLVQPALQALGITPQFWRVAVKPGKPFLFCQAGRQLVFGLPGNPVSAFVTAQLFVLPALRRFAGAAEAVPPLSKLRAAVELHNRGDRTHYLRGTRDAAAGTFIPVGAQESHAIAGLSRADALARLEPGTVIAAGEAVEVMMLD